MRLAILDNGHGLGHRALFALIRAFSGRPVLDVIKLVRYRADFYGAPMSRVTHEAMRGPSAWSVGDRELMAALVAKTNECTWCTQAHAAVASGAYRDTTRVSAALSDLETAPIEEPLKATLGLLRKLTREQAVVADDVRAVLAESSRAAPLRGTARRVVPSSWPPFPHGETSRALMARRVLFMPATSEEPPCRARSGPCDESLRDCELSAANTGAKVSFGFSPDVTTGPLDVPTTAGYVPGVEVYYVWERLGSMALVTLPAGVTVLTFQIEAVAGLNVESFTFTKM